MPRFIRYRQERVSDLRRKEFQRVESGFKRWVDPFSAVIGTLPEKMVYAALSKRGIPFWFQNEIEFKIPEIKLFKDYRPDFAIPSLKIIIEVQGAYWHSTDEAIKNDAFKFAVYQMLGWKVIAWWDFDIQSRLDDLFLSEPAFAAYPPKDTKTSSSETSNGHKIIRDDSKGVTTLNHKRGQRQAYKRDPVGQRRRNKSRPISSIMLQY